MGQDIEELARRVAEVEAPDAPRLGRQLVLDLVAEFLRASISSTTIDRSGTVMPKPPSGEMLSWTGAASSDARVTIHHAAKSEQIHVERLHFLYGPRRDVRDDALDGHLIFHRSGRMPLPLLLMSAPPLAR